MVDILHIAIFHAFFAGSKMHGNKRGKSEYVLWHPHLSADLKIAISQILIGYWNEVRATYALLESAFAFE